VEVPGGHWREAARDRPGEALEHHGDTTAQIISDERIPATTRSAVPYTWRNWSRRIAVGSVGRIVRTSGFVMLFCLPRPLLRRR